MNCEQMVIVLLVNLRNILLKIFLLCIMFNTTIYLTSVHFQSYIMSESKLPDIYFFKSLFLAKNGSLEDFLK